MEVVRPKVYLVGETRAVYTGITEYLEDVGAPEWVTDAPSDIEILCEIMGRLCYKSFKPGLNPNVSKIREGNDTYLKNIIHTKHGSVLEHGQVNFIFRNVSRVFTHELVRHRMGVAISQESLRYVRLDKLSAFVPMLIEENSDGMTLFSDTIEKLEEVQQNIAKIYEIEGIKDFGLKKKLTSAFRRVAPIGLATSIGWSCNMRALRHVIEMRTDPAAEEEIRIVFGEVFNIVSERYPNLFADYEVKIVDGLPHVTTANRKV